MTQPKNWKLYLEFPLAIGIFMLASLNLAYRPLWLITTVSVILLTACSYYFKLRHHVHLPLVVLFLAFAAVEIDTVGNHFRWYQKFPWPVPYDVFAHFTIPLLVAPALFWLIQLWFAQQGNQLPLSSIAFVTINVMFSLSAFYEITEMWDELYFGGHRIWTLHDTTRDLQWDLLGTIVGSLLTYAVLKVRQPARSPTTKSSTWPKSHKNPQQLREIPHHQLSRPR